MDDPVGQIRDLRRFGTLDRGRERRSPSPPSEPGVRFSRDGLSSQLFPHRDWRANPTSSIFQTREGLAGTCRVGCDLAAVGNTSLGELHGLPTDQHQHRLPLNGLLSPCATTGSISGNRESICLSSPFGVSLPVSASLSCRTRKCASYERICRTDHSSFKRKIPLRI